jgi:hypothetical protein
MRGERAGTAAKTAATARPVSGAITFVFVAVMVIAGVAACDDSGQRGATGAGTGGMGGTPGQAGGGPGTGGGGAGTGGGGAGTGGGGPRGPGIVASDLEGYWDGGRQIGDCIDVQRYMLFSGADRFADIDVNADACSPQARGTFMTPGQFSLSGTTLTKQRDDGTETTREDIAIGVVDGHTTLHTGVFLDAGAGAATAGGLRRRWRYVRIQDGHDAQGSPTTYSEVHVELEFDGPLPVSGAGTCTMTTRFEVIQRAPARGVSEDYSGAFAPVPCRIETVYGRQAIRLDKFPDGSDPEWVKSNAHTPLSAGLWLDPLDPSYLGTYGGWTKLDAAPAGL